jgi:hypothetical protein
VPPGNSSRGTAGLVSVPERYVAGTDTRGRPEGRPYPRSQQAIREIPGFIVEYPKKCDVVRALEKKYYHAVYLQRVNDSRKKERIEQKVIASITDNPKMGKLRCNRLIIRVKFSNGFPP